MRYALILFIPVLFLASQAAVAAAELVRISPQWINPASELQLSEQQDTMHFAAQQQKALWLASGQWLDVKQAAFNHFTFSAGSSTLALRQLTRENDFICNQSHCQLAALNHNRVIVLQNKHDDAHTITLSTGKKVHHRDSFRRSLKLPRQVTRLHYGQNVDYFYHFKRGESVTLFFQHARKVKVTVRKDLTQYDDSGKVYAYLDKNLAAIIATPVSKASEFKARQVGIANSEYLAIEKGQYLTLTSQTDAYIKVEQNHRGIYDSQVLERHQEALFQPYWSRNLEQSLNKIYLQHTLSPLSEDVWQNGDRVEQKRYQDLLTTVSKNSYLPISHTDNQQAIENKVSHFNSLSELRLVDDTLYPKLTAHYAKVYQLDENQHHFDISHITKVTPELTVYARSQVDSLFLISSGQQQWTLSLKPNSNFLAFRLPIGLSANKITVTNLNNANERIEYAISVRELLTLPNNELLYSHSAPLNEKSPTIAQLVNNHLNQLREEYLANIAPYVGQNKQPLTVDKNLSTMTFLHKLGQVEHLAQSDPINALVQLKHLVSAPTAELAIKAWQLRIKLLQQQDKGLLAKNYLEGLVKSSEQRAIKRYAVNALLKQYQALQQDYLLQGLCATAYTLAPQCPVILSQLAVKQQKNILALWLSHDILGQTPELTESFSQLNWRNFSAVKASDPEYVVSYGASQVLSSVESSYSAIQISDEMPLTITAQNTPLTLSLRVRTKSVQNGLYKMAWLYANSQQQTSLLPIYADIASSTALKQSKMALSIAAEHTYTLKPGEKLTFTSDQQAYVTYSVVPNALQQQFTYQVTAGDNLQKQDFTALLYDSSLTMRDLLINALYKLSQHQLTINEYTQLLSRTHIAPIPATLDTLYSRIKSYGEWVAITQYNDFAGTQLFDVDSISKTSYSDQLSRSSTLEDSNDGILLRPFHTLNIDLSQTQSQQIRLNFNFSGAELAQKNVANVSINTGSSELIWSVPQTELSQFGVNKSELAHNVLSLRWLNPYISQTLSVTAEQYINQRWEKLIIPNQLLFYTATKSQPVTFKLPADRLIKLEKMSEVNGASVQRIEQQFIHPAGKVEVTTQNIAHVRLYQWQLSNSNEKISTFEQPAIQYANTLVYQAPEQKAYTQSNTILAPEQLNWQAFIGYDQQSIFESAEGVPTKENLDVGVRLRLNDNEHWYRIDIAQSLSNRYSNVLSLDGYYKWRDQQSPWYATAALQTSWQYENNGMPSQYAAYTYLQLGQIWNINTAHRHQWQFTPFYNTTSADLNDYLIDEKLNSDIFNFYRNNHSTGWRGEYSYRYQPWVDNFVEFGVASNSNDDWVSLDRLEFSTSWNQFYHGHILQAELSSYYLFADDNRAIDTWQYITGLSWQKNIAIADFSQGWLKLSWQQDWFHNNHNISLEFSSGNISETGFNSFAEDEIIFPSLQFNHFLEQYNDDQR